MQASPYGENRSAEGILLETLTGVLVEAAPEWDFQARQQLRDYVNALRIAAFPNMTPREQQRIRAIAEGNPGGWSEQSINPGEIGAEIQKTWERYGFSVPNVQPGEVGSEFASFYGKPELE